MTAPIHPQSMHPANHYRYPRQLKLFFEAHNFCPMRCFSCAQGRREYPGADHKCFPPDALAKILHRLSSQVDEIVNIDLFSLGEPLLNPLLPELVSVSRRYAKRTVVSTSGNFCKCDLPRLAAARPDVFIVSVSGFTQPIYSVIHRGGDIERVKRFLVRLADAGLPSVSVVYHRYRHNLHEEEPMRRFARSLGFRFVPAWALHLHIEAMQRGDHNPYLIVPMKEQLAIAKRQKDYPCYLYQNGLLFDPAGNLRSCAGSADPTTFGNVFTHTLGEMLALKRDNPLCRRCYDTGAYKVYSAQNIIIDRECARRIKAGPLVKLKWRLEVLRKHVWTWRELKRIA